MAETPQSRDIKKQPEAKEYYNRDLATKSLTTSLLANSLNASGTEMVEDENGNLVEKRESLFSKFMGKESMQEIQEEAKAEAEDPSKKKGWFKNMLHWGGKISSKAIQRVGELVTNKEVRKGTVNFATDFAANWFNSNFQGGEKPTTSEDFTKVGGLNFSKAASGFADKLTGTFETELQSKLTKNKELSRTDLNETISNSADQTLSYLSSQFEGGKPGKGILILLQRLSKKYGRLEVAEIEAYLKHPSQESNAGRLLKTALENELERSFNVQRYLGNIPEYQEFANKNYNSRFGSDIVKATTPKGIIPWFTKKVGVNPWAWLAVAPAAVLSSFGSIAVGAGVVGVLGLQKLASARQIAKQGENNINAIVNKIAALNQQRKAENQPEISVATIYSILNELAANTTRTPEILNSWSPSAKAIFRDIVTTFNQTAGITNREGEKVTGTAADLVAAENMALQMAMAEAEAANQQAYQEGQTNPELQNNAFEAMMGEPRELSDRIQDEIIQPLAQKSGSNANLLAKQSFLARQKEDVNKVEVTNLEGFKKVAISLAQSELQQMAIGAGVGIVTNTLPVIDQVALGGNIGATWNMAWGNSSVETNLSNGDVVTTSHSTENIKGIEGKTKVTVGQWTVYTSNPAAYKDGIPANLLNQAASNATKVGFDSKHMTYQNGVLSISNERAGLWGNGTKLNGFAGFGGQYLNKGSSGQLVTLQMPDGSSKVMMYQGVAQDGAGSNTQRAIFTEPNAKITEAYLQHSVSENVAPTSTPATEPTPTVTAAPTLEPAPVEQAAPLPESVVSPVVEAKPTPEPVATATETPANQEKVAAVQQPPIPPVTEPKPVEIPPSAPTTPAEPPRASTEVKTNGGNVSLVDKVNAERKAAQTATPAPETQPTVAANPQSKAQTLATNSQIPTTQEQASSSRKVDQQASQITNPSVDTQSQVAVKENSQTLNTSNKVTESTLLSYNNISQQEASEAVSKLKPLDANSTPEQVIKDSMLRFRASGNQLSDSEAKLILQQANQQTIANGVNSTQAFSLRSIRNSIENLPPVTFGSTTQGNSGTSLVRGDLNTAGNRERTTTLGVGNRQFTLNTGTNGNVEVSTRGSLNVGAGGKVGFTFKNEQGVERRLVDFNLQGKLGTNGNALIFQNGSNTIEVDPQTLSQADRVALVGPLDNRISNALRNGNNQLAQELYQVRKALIPTTQVAQASTQIPPVTGIRTEPLRPNPVTTPTSRLDGLRPISATNPDAARVTTTSIEGAKTTKDGVVILPNDTRFTTLDKGSNLNRYVYDSEKGLQVMAVSPDGKTRSLVQTNQGQIRIDEETGQKYIVYETNINGNKIQQVAPITKDGRLIRQDDLDPRAVIAATRAISQPTVVPVSTPTQVVQPTVSNLPASQDFTMRVNPNAARFVEKDGSVSYTDPAKIPDNVPYRIGDKVFINQKIETQPDLRSIPVAITPDRLSTLSPQLQQQARLLQSQPAIESRQSPVTQVSPSFNASVEALQRNISVDRNNGGLLIATTKEGELITVKQAIDGNLAIINNPRSTPTQISQARERLAAVEAAQTNFIQKNAVQLTAGDSFDPNKDFKVDPRYPAGTVIIVKTKDGGEFTYTVREKGATKPIEAVRAASVPIAEQRSGVPTQLEIPSGFVPLTFTSNISTGNINPLTEIAIKPTDLVSLPGASANSSALITINGKTETLAFTRNADGAYKAVIKGGDGKYYTLDTKNPLVQKALESDPQSQKLFNSFNPDTDIPRSKQTRTLDNATYYDPKLPKDETSLRALNSKIIIDEKTGRTLNNFISNNEIPSILANETGRLAKAFGIDTQKLDGFIDGGRNLDSNVENLILRKAASGQLTTQEQEALTRYALTVRALRAQTELSNQSGLTTGDRNASNNSTLYNIGLDSLDVKQRPLAAAGQRLMGMLDGDGKLTPNSIRNGDHIGLGASESDYSRQVGTALTAAKGLTVVMNEKGEYVNPVAFGSKDWSGLVDSNGIPRAFSGMLNKLDSSQTQFIIEQTKLAKEGKGYFGPTDGTIATIQAEAAKAGRTVPTRDQIVVASIIAGFGDYLGQPGKVPGLSEVNGVRPVENFGGYFWGNTFGDDQRSREQSSSSFLKAIVAKFAPENVEGVKTSQDNSMSAALTINQRPINNPADAAKAALGMILSPNFMVGFDVTSTQSSSASFGTLDPKAYQVTKDENGLVTVKYNLASAGGETPLTGAEMAYLVQGVTGGNIGVGMGIKAYTDVSGSATPIELKIQYENTQGAKQNLQTFLKISESVFKSPEFDRDDASTAKYQQLLTAKAQELRAKGLISEKDYQIAVTLSSREDVRQALFSNRGNIAGAGEFGELINAKDYVSRRGEPLNLNTVSSIPTTTGYTISQLTSMQGGSQAQTVSNLFKATVTDRLNIPAADASQLESALRKAAVENNSFNPNSVKLPAGYTIATPSQQDLINAGYFNVVKKPDGSEYIAYTTVMSDGSVEARLIPKNANLSWHVIKDQNGQIIASMRNTETCTGNFDIPIKPELSNQLQIQSNLDCIERGICQVGQYEQIKAQFEIEELRQNQIKKVYAESIKQNGNSFTGPLQQLTQAIYQTRATNNGVVNEINKLALDYSSGKVADMNTAIATIEQKTGIKVTKEFLDRYLESGGIQADRVDYAKVDQEYSNTFGIAFGIGMPGLGLKFGNEQTINSIAKGELKIVGLTVNAQGEPCVQLATTSIGEANYHHKEEITLAVVFKPPVNPPDETPPEPPVKKEPKLGKVNTQVKADPAGRPVTVDPAKAQNNAVQFKTGTQVQAPPPATKAFDPVIPKTNGAIGLGNVEKIQVVTTPSSTAVNAVK